MESIPDDALSKIQSHWSKFVQSPAQLGFTRTAKFKPKLRNQLVDLLSIKKNAKILEIGCGMGILSSRLLETNITSHIWACDLDVNFLNTALPEELQSDCQPRYFLSNGLRLPFPDNFLDRVISHTVVNLFDRETREQLHRELNRVLVNGGTVTHMDGIGGNAWTPDSLNHLESEQKRRSEFFQLLEEIHNELNSGFTNTRSGLPQELRNFGFEPVEVEVFSSALRLNNDEWTELQKKKMLELWQKADRDRIERLRNLLELTDEMNDGRAQLFRQCVSDAQQQALRRRKALENNQELGWRSSTTLVVSGRL